MTDLIKTTERSNLDIVKEEFNTNRENFEIAINEYSDERSNFFKLWKSIGGNPIGNTDLQTYTLSDFSSEEYNVFKNNMQIPIWRKFTNPFEYMYNYGGADQDPKVYKSLNDQYPGLITELKENKMHIENMTTKLLPNIKEDVNTILSQTNTIEEEK